MDSANESVTAYVGDTLLAGLQSGILAVLALLVWMGVSAVWQGRSFWTAANLMASSFYGDAAIHSGFAHSTLSGLALYVVLYGALGAVFAAAVNGHVRGVQLLLFGLLFGLAWYYCSFGLLWKRFSPLMALLHAERPTMVGHLIYGGLTSRYTRYLPRPEA
jgi:hypothetical protein